MWALIDGSPRRGETPRSAWKRDAAIIRPINGDAYGNVRETLGRDNEEGRRSLAAAFKRLHQQDGLLAPFIHQEGGGVETWRNASAGAAGMLLGQRGSFAFLDNELISHPGPLKQQKYKLMLLWRIRGSDPANVGPVTPSICCRLAENKEMARIVF